MKRVLGVAVASALLLASCKTTSEVMESWVGVEANKLVTQWGPPNQKYQMNDGRTMYIYRDTSIDRRMTGYETETRCPEPTYETQGTITGYGDSYNYESTTRSRQGPCFVTDSGPTYEHVEVKCERRFVVNREGRIDSWSYDGAGC